MDGSQFDALVTRASTTRRPLVASLLAAVIGRVTFEPTVAGRGKAKGKGKKSKGKKKGRGKKATELKPCADKSTCPKYHICYLGSCVEACENSDDCPPHAYCEPFDLDPRVGSCTIGCDDHAYCAEVLGTRLSRCNFTTHSCERIECILDGDCTPPKTCRDNFTCT